MDSRQLEINSQNRLNPAQKNILEATIKFYFEGIIESTKSLTTAIDIFQNILDRSIFTSLENLPANLEEIRDCIMGFHELFTHAYPQNRKIGDPSAASDHEDGVINGVVYYWKNGFGNDLRKEQQGILGLTAYMEPTQNRLRKNDVVEYIDFLIERKMLELRLIKKYRALDINRKRELYFSFVASNIANINDVLFETIRNNDLNDFKLALELGANVDYLQYGKSPLLLIAQKGNVTMFDFILQYKPSINGADRLANGLHAAVDIGHIEIVHKLLLRGADPNHRDSLGFTPLHCAVHRGENALVRLLIIHGAKVNVVSNAGLSPLDYACLHHKKEIVSILKSSGARMTEKWFSFYQQMKGQERMSAGDDVVDDYRVKRRRAV